MYDDVARSQRGASRVVEPEPVDADIAGDDREPPFDGRVERVAEFSPKAVERIVAQDLAPHAVSRGASATAADEHDDVGVGRRSQ